MRDSVRGMFKTSWTARLLGQSVQLAMRPSEELAINQHFNVNNPHRTYHVQPPGTFEYRPRNNLSWFEYNPAVLAASGSSAESTLFNIKQGGGEPLNLSGVAQTSVLWVEGKRDLAKVKLEIRNAEDARPFVLNGAAHAIFVRYRKRRLKSVWFARLEQPYREVKLTYDQQASSEGNWLPFVHDGKLFVSYSLCPHRVLAVDPLSGVCVQAYETRAPGCSPGERGSASGVYHATSGSVVGLGHLRSYAYHHFFFARESQPPFRPFRIPLGYPQDTLNPKPLAPTLTLLP